MISFFNIFLLLGVICIILIVLLSVLPLYRCKRCGKRCSYPHGEDKLCRACWEASGGPQLETERLRRLEMEKKRQEEEEKQRIQNKIKLAEERSAKRKQTVWYKTLMRVLWGMASAVVMLIILSVFMAFFYSPQAVHFFGIAGILLLISTASFLLIAFGNLDNVVPMGEGMAALVAFVTLIIGVYNLVRAFIELFKSF